MEETKEEFEDTAQVKGTIDYEQLLLQQVNRIAQIASRHITAEEYKRELPDAVESLYQLLTPYIDNQYRSDVTKLTTDAKANKEAYGEYGYSLSKFGLLLALMDRLNLLLEKKMQEVVE